MSLIQSFISHQIWLQQNASHEVNELAPFIQKMRDEVRKKVRSFGDDSRTRQNLEKLLKDLNSILLGISGDWETRLTEDLQKLAKYEIEWNGKTLTAAFKTEFVTPSPEQVWSAIKFTPLGLDNKPVDFTALISGWGATEVNRMAMGVKSGFVQGLTTRQIIQNVVGAGGLADISQRNAATVIRTALNHVSTESREMVYKKNNDLIKKYEIVATLDSRTSTICRYYDGQQYEVGKGPLPPFHPNCRTTTAPVLSSEFDFLDAGAKRAARGADGGTQVNADTTYYEFLKQQPAWFQDKALGTVRGSIFRNAGMSAEEFRKASVDGFGRPLTLKEMAEADKRVAEYLEGK